MPDTASPVPAAEHPPAATRPLSLPISTVIGLGVGLLTGLTDEYNWHTKAPVLSSAALALAWTAGLGAVFLPARQQRLGAVALAVLLGILGGVQGHLSLGNSNANTYGYPIPSNLVGWPILALLGVAGLLLLSGWQGHGWGKRGPVQAPPFVARLVPPFAVHALLSFVLAGLLGGLFYALLLLAAALLEAVGLRGPMHALQQVSVIYPLLLGASAFFVAAIRAQPWGLALTRTLANVLGFLLPIAAAIVLLFAAVLPIAAVQDSQKLYHGLLSSPLYLTLSLIFAGLSLAVFSARPVTLPAPLQTFSRWAAYLLPLYPALALYGLGVRVGQYGLTEERLVGLAAAFWLLTTGLALAFTRNRPAFAGLSRATALSLGVLAALTLLLSVPGLRPVEWSARSQAARLTGSVLAHSDPSHSGLTRKQTAEIVAQLAYESGPLGRRLLTNIPASQLSPEAQALRQSSQRLDRIDFLQQNVWNQNGQPLQNEIVLSPGSLPLTETQKSEIKKTMTAENIYLQRPHYAYAMPLGKEMRVMVNGQNNWYEGLWLDFDGAGQIIRHGTFSALERPQNTRKVNWYKNPFDAGAKADTVILPVVKTGGVTLILQDK